MPGLSKESDVSEGIASKGRVPPASPLGPPGGSQEPSSQMDLEFSDHGSLSLSDPPTPGQREPAGSLLEIAQSSGEYFFDPSQSDMETDGEL